MIKTHSDDPDVAHAAGLALGIIKETLANLAQASEFDYGGHELKVGEYEVCTRCTQPIAEAQAAERALRDKAESTPDDTVREHISLAADLFKKEAEAAVIRAEFHNGRRTEPILNLILAFQHDRAINDDYSHSHHGGL